LLNSGGWKTVKSWNRKFDSPLNRYIIFLNGSSQKISDKKLQLQE